MSVLRVVPSLMFLRASGLLVQDAASFAFMMKNFRRCPKCRTYLERTEGCNHMTCRRNVGGCGCVCGAAVAVIVAVIVVVAATMRQWMMGFCGMYSPRVWFCSRHEFCYMCKGPWSEHGSHTGGYYNCKFYNKATDKKLLSFEHLSEEEKAKLNEVGANDACPLLLRCQYG